MARDWVGFNKVENPVKDLPQFSSALIFSSSLYHKPASQPANVVSFP